MIVDDHRAIADRLAELRRDRAMASIGVDDKTVATCLAKLNNLVRFKGFLPFPKIPDRDDPQ